MSRLKGTLGNFNDTKIVRQEKYRFINSSLSAIPTLYHTNW